MRVNGELLEADRIFINVGARALVPEMPGIDEIDYLTNSSMMHVDFLPKHLVIMAAAILVLSSVRCIAASAAASPSSKSASG